jgi:hypothetical protein
MSIRFYAFCGAILIGLIFTGCGPHYNNYFSLVGEVNPKDTSIVVYYKRFFPGMFYCDPETGECEDDIFPNIRQNRLAKVSSSGEFVVTAVGSDGFNQHPNDFKLTDIRIFEVYIDHPDYEVYHDTLSTEELEQLPKISGYIDDSFSHPDYHHGAWRLPDITLIPKKDSLE